MLLFWKGCIKNFVKDLYKPSRRKCFINFFQVMREPAESFPINFPFEPVLIAIKLHVFVLLSHQHDYSEISIRPESLLQQQDCNL